MSCSVPISVSFQHSYKNNKQTWANSVIFIATRQTELICVDSTCAPISVNYGAGTSFIIDSEDDKTTLMTAAHLCYAMTVPELQESMIDEIATIETKFDMTIAINETPIPIEKILYIDKKTDICIFSVPINIGKPLRFARKAPKYGDGVWSIGAPAGYFPESAKPITKGIFSGEAGRTIDNNEILRFYNFTMPTIGGMSGSPIVNSRGEVVGIVSAVNGNWHMISFSPTLYQIIESTKDLD